MSRQDKALTERHTRILRELVKQPDNKSCADCKRNDPRWASWNLGVFLCIRCSGIHRSMGTHISKVKSIDLDVWTPDQMDSIAKWGNRRANAYWEAHLKSGHVPPEHKVESFIRSKYESRRWATEGPPPLDTSALDDSNIANVVVNRDTPSQYASLPKPPFTTSMKQAITTQRSAPQTESRNLLSSSPQLVNPSVTAAAPVNLPQTSSDDLFSLDFTSPTSGNHAAPDVGTHVDKKHNILSLYSSAPMHPPSNISQNVTSWQTISPGNNWTASSAGTAATTSQVNSDVNVWSNRNELSSNNKTPQASGNFMDEAFGDIWGGSRQLS